MTMERLDAAIIFAVERLFGSRVAELVASDSEDKMEALPADGIKWLLCDFGETK